MPLVMVFCLMSYPQLAQGMQRYMPIIYNRNVEAYAEKVLIWLVSDNVGPIERKEDGVATNISWSQVILSERWNRIFLRESARGCKS